MIERTIVKKLKYCKTFSLPTNSKTKFKKIEPMKINMICTNCISEKNIFFDSTTPGNHKLKQKRNMNIQGTKANIFSKKVLEKKVRL